MFFFKSEKIPYPTNVFGDDFLKSTKTSPLNEEAAFKLRMLWEAISFKVGYGKSIRLVWFISLIITQFANYFDLIFQLFSGSSLYFKEKPIVLDWIHFFYPSQCLPSVWRMFLHMKFEEIKSCIIIIPHFMYKTISENVLSFFPYSSLGLIIPTSH